MASKQRTATAQQFFNASTSRAIGIINEVGISPANGVNPIWLAISGLSALSANDIAQLVADGEVNESEGQAMLATSQRGQDLADKLRPLMWKGKSSNKNAVMEAYVTCQNICYDVLGGPSSDGSTLNTMRQRWYYSKNSDAMGFKFASQAVERFLIRDADVVVVGDETAMNRARDQGAKSVQYKTNWTSQDAKLFKEEHKRLPKVHIWPKGGWGRTYNQLQSQILKAMVDNGLTYEEMWIEDASRKRSSFYSPWRDFYAILALEKEGLFAMWEPFCNAVGIPMMLSMQGNSGAASIENILNSNKFRNYDGTYRPTRANPLHLIVLSDHDYAGHVPVMEGVLAQVRRYLGDAVQLHRLGITPEQVEEQGRSVGQAGYEFEEGFNKAWAEWAEREAVYIAGVPYGIEVEALEVGDFVRDLVYLVADILGGEDALRKILARLAKPDMYQVQYEMADQLNNHVQALRWIASLQEVLEEHGKEIKGYVSQFLGIRLGSEYDPDAWVGSDKVQDTITSAITKAMEGVGIEGFVESVEDGQQYRPVGSAQVERVIKTQFWTEHIEVQKDERDPTFSEWYDTLDVPSFLDKADTFYEELISNLKSAAFSLDVELEGPEPVLTDLIEDL